MANHICQCDLETKTTSLDFSSCNVGKLVTYDTTYLCPDTKEIIRKSSRVDLCFPRCISRCSRLGSRRNMRTLSSNPLIERTQVPRTRWLHTSKKLGIRGFNPRQFFWIFRQIFGLEPKTFYVFTVF